MLTPGVRSLHGTVAWLLSLLWGRGRGTAHIKGSPKWLLPLPLAAERFACPVALPLSTSQG